MTLFTKSLFVVLLLSAQLGLTQNSPGQYMENLTSQFDELDNEKWQYLKAITRGKSARKIDNKRQKLITEYRNVRSEIGKIRKYKGDTLLKQSILDYLKLTQLVLNEDYGKIMDLEEIADQSYDGMEAYLTAQEEASKKLENAFIVLQENQQLFAKQNDITLVSEDLDKRKQKILKASEALEYYNDLYLIFYKCSHQESYVMDALDRNDVNSLEQSLNTLATFSDEGIEKLKGEKAFKGDSSLKSAVQKMLLFYKNEASKDFPQIVDFYVAKDEMEKQQKKIEAKSKKNRTQADIDKYNSASKKYNAGVNKFNSIIEKTNKNRNLAISNFNKTVDAFFERNGG